LHFLLLDGELDRLWLKSRGDSSSIVTEQMVAERNAPRDYQNVHPWGYMNKATIGDVGWFRCMAYGFNGVGAVPAESLEGGERFLLYTVTYGGKQAIARQEVRGEQTVGAPAYIEPADAVYAATTPAFRPTSSADFNIASMASDGRYLYVRFYAVSGAAAPGLHMLACYDIVYRTAVWIIEMAHGVTDVFTGLHANQHHIAVVKGSTYIAVNQSWKDLVPVSGGAYGIELRSVTDGTVVSTGHGNAISAGWATVYAAGPICSDGGANVFFTVRAAAGDGLNNQYMVAQCTIANPLVAQTGAAATPLDGDDYNPSVGTFEQGPRGMVFDGEIVWLTTMFTLSAWVPVPAAGASDHFVSNTSVSYHMFGDVFCDGRYLYFAACDIDGSGDSSAAGMLVRMNPCGVLPYVVTGDSFAGLGALAGTSVCNLWSLFKPAAAKKSWFYALSSKTDVPFGNGCYTGDTLWWTTYRYYFHGNMVTPVYSNTLQRLGNVHGV
jgi:hypothetical protein